MFRLGIIEESLKDKKVLKHIAPYLVAWRVEEVPEDEYPIWHINEYHLEERQICEILDILKEKIKETWYIHAFDDKELYVVLRGKRFDISLHKDETWDEMIEYGVHVAKVERSFLEKIPLHV